MLRPLKCPNLKARLLAYTATTAASGVNTVQVGTQEGTFSNASSDNDIDLTFAQAFSREPVLVATAGADIGDGGYARLFGPSTATTSTVATFSGSGSADVGTQHALLLGFDSTETSANGGRFSRQFPVKSSFDKPRIIAGRVSASGEIEIGGSQFTVADNGTGDHTITFGRGFAKNPVVVVTPFNATDGITARVESVSKTSVNILTFGALDSAVDSGFNFIVYGSDNGDEIRKDLGSTVMVPWRKPRLLAFQIEVSAGTPTLTIGSDLGTVADDGAGEFTITYAESFARAPVVVACARGSVPVVTIDASTSTACGIEVSDAGGTLGDPSSVDILVFGSDSEEEF